MKSIVKVILVALVPFLTASPLATGFAQESVPASQNTNAPVTANAPVPTPPVSETALNYYHSGNVLWVVENLWQIGILLVLLFSGGSARIRNWAGKIGKRWFFVVVVYFIVFALITTIVGLPLSYYSEFVREHAYGLSNQTFGKWLGDALKSFLIQCIFGSIVVWLAYIPLRKSPKRWWLYVGLGTVPLFCLFLLIVPIWVQPLFNKFGPMKDKVLEAKVLALAGQAGIEGTRVFEVNKSVDTKALNAYVTGFGSTKRIVIWDNTIAKLSEGELLFVLGHEMGHYVLGHIWKLIAFNSAMILIALFFADRLARLIIARNKDRFGFDQLSDIASLPLILLLVNLFGIFLINPVGNWMSRGIEHDADQFGLEVTKANHDAATAFVKLQMENLSNPRPALWFKIMRANHPVLGDRIDYANSYRPWETGEKLKYEEYFIHNQAKRPDTSEPKR